MGEMAGRPEGAARTFECWHHSPSKFASLKQVEGEPRKAAEASIPRVVGPWSNTRRRSELRSRIACRPPTYGRGNAQNVGRKSSFASIPKVNSKVQSSVDRASGITYVNSRWGKRNMNPVIRAQVKDYSKSTSIEAASLSDQFEIYSFLQL